MFVHFLYTLSYTTWLWGLFIMINYCTVPINIKEWHLLVEQENYLGCHNINKGGIKSWWKVWGHSVVILYCNWLYVTDEVWHIHISWFQEGIINIYVHVSKLSYVWGFYNVWHSPLNFNFLTYPFPFERKH